MLCKSCYQSIIPTPKLVNGSLFYGIHFFAEWHQTYLYLCLVVNWSLCFSPYLYGRSPPPPWPPLAWRAAESVSSRGFWAGPGRPRRCRSLSPRPPPFSQKCHLVTGGHWHYCSAQLVSIWIFLFTEPGIEIGITITSLNVRIGTQYKVTFHLLSSLLPSSRHCPAINNDIFKFIFLRVYWTS